MLACLPTRPEKQHSSAVFRNLNFPPFDPCPHSTFYGRAQPSLHAVRGPPHLLQSRLYSKEDLPGKPSPVRPPSHTGWVARCFQNQTDRSSDHGGNNRPRFCNPPLDSRTLIPPKLATILNFQSLFFPPVLWEWKNKWQAWKLKLSSPTPTKTSAQTNTLPASCGCKPTGN